MRDLLVTFVILGSLPATLFRPFYGVLAWSWISYMNPHRLSWGFAYNFPFAQLVGIATLAGFVFTKDKRGIPFTGLVAVWVSLVLWFNLTTLFALNSASAAPEWDRTMKIQLFSFITVMLVHRKKQIDALIWVIALSLGFFGVKGGIFAVLTGANHRVYGPPGSFFEDNNALALALIMALPLIRYLQLNAEKRVVRLGLAAAFGLTVLAILSSHSRGAFVALSVVLMVFIWKSRGRIWFLLALPLVVPILWSFLPPHWHERMMSIQNYEQDGSAMGRVNAWWFAFNLALDRPLVGGGFNAFTPELFLKYAPEPFNFHDSHSIYFEMMAEHGFVGIGLFLMLGFLCFMTGSSIIRSSKRSVETRWTGDLAAMLQIGIVGYAVCGAFLGLAYFDLYYHFVALTVILKRYVADDLTASSEREQLTDPIDALSEQNRINETVAQGPSQPLSTR